MDATLGASLLLVLVSSALIQVACTSFEQATEHLGRRVFRMPPGVRGATLEAVGSSMPELLTTSFLLFLFHDVGGFAAGIATCAGSAVFNVVLIPALCVLAVSSGEAARAVRLDRSVILRDGAFLLLAEVLLIVFLGDRALAWWMGAALLAVYLVYLVVLWRQTKAFAGGSDEHETDHGPGDEEDGATGSWLARLVRLDWNGMLFSGRPLTAGSAWTILGLSVATLTGACYLLAEAVMRSAAALGVPPYFSAVILGAAATSVPDTLISMANARKGDDDDAVSNAVGSNIFDICVALGLPLLVYGAIHGPVGLSLDGLAVSDPSAPGVQPLRIALLGVTLAALGLFLFGGREGPATRVGRGKALVLLGLYGLWTGTIVAQALQTSFTT